MHLPFSTKCGPTTRPSRTEFRIWRIQTKDEVLAELMAEQVAARKRLGNSYHSALARNDPGLLAKSQTTIRLRNRGVMYDLEVPPRWSCQRANRPISARSNEASPCPYRLLVTYFLAEPRLFVKPRI